MASPDKLFEPGSIFVDVVHEALDRFLAGMDGVFPVVQTGVSTLNVSLDTLPSQPTIMVLRPAYLREPR